MITAGITAAVGALLALFGVKPGPYLVGVAVAVKVSIILATLVVGARWARRRRAAGGQDGAAARPGGPEPGPPPARRPSGPASGD